MENIKFTIDFIGIGASRSGSTWISQCLQEHPEVCFPSIKEVNFFNRDENYNKGMDYYKTFFIECQAGQIKGEYTPNYMRIPKVAKRIHENFPEVKLIACLRNPIERAYSQYFYNKSKEKETATSFEEALTGRLKNNYLNKGNYYQNLLHYLNLFDKKNILILVYEDIRRSPKNFVTNIYSFLNIDANFIPPSLEKMINTSSAKNKQTYIPYYNQAINYLKKNNSNKIITGAKKITKATGIDKAAKKIFDLNKKGPSTNYEKKPGMDPRIRSFLNNYYREEINNLEKILNRNLDFWK